MTMLSTEMGTNFWVEESLLLENPRCPKKTFSELMNIVLPWPTNIRQTAGVIVGRVLWKEKS